MELDKIITRSRNFMFGIVNTLFIGTITLNISLRVIIFHIIYVNILFILCFIDIDKLGAFFNNFINEVIQFNRSYPILC